MMEFLYFPENKLEYIPAVISCVIFFIGAFATFRVFQKASKKELERTEQMYYDKKEENDVTSTTTSESPTTI